MRSLILSLNRLDRPHDGLKDGGPKGKNYKNKNGATPLQLAVVILFAAMDASIIGPFLGSFVKSHGMSLTWVGIILSSKNVSRIIFDLPAAAVFDTFGPKLSFTISRLSRLSSVAIMMLWQSELSFIVSMVLYGISMCSFYGKMEPYLVQCSGRNARMSSQRLLSTYSVMSNVVMILSGGLAAYLFPKVGYWSLAGYTILTAAASLLLLPFMPTTNVKTSSERHPLQKIKESAKFVFKKREVLNAVLLLSLIQFLIWRTNNVLNVMLLNLKVTPQWISIISTAHFAFTLLGYSVQLFVKDFNRKLVQKIVFAVLGLFVVTLPMLNAVSLAVFFLLASVLPLAQISYEKALGGIFRNHSLAIIMSFSNSVASVYTITLSVLSGVLGDLLPHRMATIFTLLPILLIAIFSRFKPSKAHE